MKIFGKWRPVWNTPGEGAGAGAGGAGDAGAGAAGAGQQQQQQQPAAGSWIPQTLPEEARNFLSAQAYGKAETPEAALLDLYNRHKATEGVAEMLPIPKDPADQPAWDKVFSKLGRPEAPEKYELKFPEGITPEESIVEFARKQAFALGASPEKAQKMVDAYLEVEMALNKQRAADINKANGEAVAVLQKQYGDQFDGLVADGQRAVQALGLSDAALAFFDQNKGSAVIMELAAKIGRGLKEGVGLVPSGGVAGGLTPAQALQEINKMTSNPETQAILQNKRHPEYAATLERYEMLGKQAYPPKKGA